MPNHSKEEKVHFFPNVLLVEASLAIAVMGLLAIFVSLFPLKLGEKFDPMNPPSIIEPEWYFMGVYQFLKTQSVQPLYGILLMSGLAILLVIVPFIDRGEERLPLRRPFFTAITFLVAVEFFGLTIFGYLSPGQVGSFASGAFTTAFLTTNLVAVVLVLLVVAAGSRSRRHAP